MVCTSGRCIIYMYLVKLVNQIIASMLCLCLWVEHINYNKILRISHSTLNWKIFRTKMLFTQRKLYISLAPNIKSLCSNKNQGHCALHAVKGTQIKFDCHFFVLPIWFNMLWFCWFETRTLGQGTYVLDFHLSQNELP